jgi:hypothetical protein
MLDVLDMGFPVIGVLSVKKKNNLRYGSLLLEAIGLLACCCARGFAMCRIAREAVLGREAGAISGATAAGICCVLLVVHCPFPPWYYWRPFHPSLRCSRGRGGGRRVSSGGWVGGVSPLVFGLV